MRCSRYSTNGKSSWDGFRCIAFRAGDELDLRSRHGRPLARYFPELVEGLGAIGADRFAIDGEIVLAGERGFDFPALMARLHPAKARVERLRRETPAAFVGIRPARARKRGPARASVRRATRAARRPAGGRLRAHPPHPGDGGRGRGARVARALPGRGDRRGDGQAPDDPYQPGVRAIAKVKRQRTADCVVGGFRVFAGEPVVAFLLLGLYDAAGGLQHVGVVSSFQESRRRELFEELRRIASRRRCCRTWRGGP